MTIYIAPNNRQISVPINAKYNQVILSGTDASFPVADGIFFVEYIEAEKLGTVNLKDGKGNTIISGITSFNQDYSPIRCDFGVEVTGTLIILKGFFVPGIFQEVV
jgi:hypothetical protein